MSLKHLLVVASLAGTAHADVTAAARAFQEAQAAQLAGDYDGAAQNYELAYQISPTKEALRSAVRARMQGQQLPRAASLAELLLANYASDPASVKLASDVIKEAKLKLARVSLSCTAPCTAAIDGKAATLSTATSHAFYLASGPHEVEVLFDGDLSVKRKLDGEAGVTFELKVDKPAPKVVTPPPPPPTPDQPPHQEQPPPSPPPPPPPHHRGGLPKWVAYGGAGLTLVLAGYTTWSGLDTWSAHDAYVKNPTDAAFSAGQSKQSRTNTALAATLVVGAGTAVVALFFTKWHPDPEEPPLVVTASAHGGAAAYSWRF